MQGNSDDVNGHSLCSLQVEADLTSLQCSCSNLTKCCSHKKEKTTARKETLHCINARSNCSEPSDDAFIGFPSMEMRPTSNDNFRLHDSDAKRPIRERAARPAPCWRDRPLASRPTSLASNGARNGRWRPLLSLCPASVRRDCAMLILLDSKWPPCDKDIIFAS